MTPLSSWTTSVSGHVGNLGNIGRGGVVLAMSSGLVATMGLPAQAIGRAAGPEAAAPATAPIAVEPAVAFSGGLIAAPAALDGSSPLTAPAAATVLFEHSAFTAVPKKAASHSAGRFGSAGAASFSAGAFGSASSVIAVAARYVGVRYRWGGTTTAGWDCSGAMVYIFRQVGIHLPRTANDQMLASKRISRSEVRAGDLVFFVSRGRAYHVGLVAGNGMMYDAQHSGKSFVKRAIYSANVVYGRVS